MILLRCIQAEIKKAKSARVWLAFLIIPVLPAIMGTFNYLNNLALLQSGWYSLWTQHTLFYATFFYGPLIAIYCSWLWRLEHVNGNWNMIMTAPVPESCIYLSKFLMAAGMSLLTQGWVGILFYLSGKYAGLTDPIPAEMFIWLVRGCIGGLAVAALQLLLSMVIRSFSLPIIFAFFGSILGLLVLSHGSGLYFPYSLMAMGMNSNRIQDSLAGMGLPFLCSTAIYTALFLIIGIMILKKKDVSWQK